MKTAVILFNLGGPDSKQSIKPFLFNFFMDKNIIRLPLPLRYLIARSISKKRSANEAGKSYALLGDKSPLLENTQAQAHALQAQLGDDYKVFISMRYWHPMADEVARQVRNWDPDKIILLPLYPQFSTTTTRSSFQTWKRAAQKCGLDKPTDKICCYPFNEGFIQASADNIRAVYEQARKDGYENPRILFSAHGLPEMVIKDGDPYQWQCEEGAKKIAAALGIENLDWSICYQSRVGRLKWIGPSTEEELERAAKDKTAVIIYPHAFTQEHVETLVEIEIEYREKAHELGVPGFYRVPTVSTQPAFIEGLADNILSVFNQTPVCPQEFRRCCRRSDTCLKC
ncbi:MAG: ferrochelatase [Alphaproteobacteria bacterium]|nr:ferrochelatase [Alphaproteobacteria bacterium]